MVDDVRSPVHAVVENGRRRNRLARLALAAGLAAGAVGAPLHAQDPGERFTNSIGMELVRIVHDAADTHPVVVATK